MGYLVEQTGQTISQQLQNFSNRASNLIGRLNYLETLYEQQNYTLINQREAMNYEKELVDDNDKKLYNTSQMTTRLRKARESLHMDKAYNEGYLLLNEIGEYFYGEEWQYRITVSGTNNKIYSFIMPLKEFVTNLKMSGTEGMVVYTAKQLMDKYGVWGNNGELLESNNNNVKIVDWEDQSDNKVYNRELYEAYSQGVSYGKKILNNSKRYNKGNILEGYMAYIDIENEMIAEIRRQNLENIQGIALEAKGAHLGGSTTSYLAELFTQLQKQTNSIGFWAGPDTRYQEKGNGASAYQFSTIINQLEKVRVLFNNLNFDKLTQKIEDVKKDISSDIAQKWKSIIEQLTAGFQATQINAEDLNASIASQIAEI